MKSLIFSSKPGAALPGTFSSVKKAVAGTVAGMAFLFAPLAERALAQPAAKEQQAPSLRVSGTQVQIKNISEHAYSSTGSNPAIVTAHGPIELSIGVYPIIQAWKFGTNDFLELDISYMLDGKIYSVRGRVSRLEEKVDGIEIPKGWTLCSTVEIQLAIPEGAHEFSLTDPEAIIDVDEKLALVNLVTGKIEHLEPLGVVSSTADKGQIKKPKKTEIPSQTTDKKVSSVQAKPESNPPLLSKPEQNPEHQLPDGVRKKRQLKANSKQKTPSRLIDLRGRRVNLVGPNSGDVNEIEILATPLVSDMLAVAVGSTLSSHGRELELAAFRQTMRSFSANLGAGLGISRDGHNAFLMVFGGVRKTDGMLTLPNGRSDPLHHMEAEYGASAGYDYNGVLGVCVLGSSNPFSPGRVELYASLPYWYLDNNFPTLSADVRWLHLLRENVVQDIIGKTSLDATDIQSRLMLSIPLAKLGPIVPSVLGGVDLSTAGGLTVSGHAGAALGADLFDTIKLEVGAAYGFDGRLLVILNGRLLR